MAVNQTLNQTVAPTTTPKALDQITNAGTGAVRVAPDGCTKYRETSTPKRWLGIWAHPDDEAYLSAGAMDCIIRSGGEVTVVALSDGELGFSPDDRRSTSIRRLHRRAELRAAMAEIGVHDVRFLGLPDGGVDEATTDDTIATLVSIIEEIQPHLLATFGPDGITGHPDHVACWEMVTRAWLESGQGGDLWYAAKTVSWLDHWRRLHDDFGVWMTDEPTGVADDTEGAVLDIAGPALDRKRAVLARHASQTRALAAAFGEDDYRAWINQETFRPPTEVELARSLVRRYRRDNGSDLLVVGRELELAS